VKKFILLALILSGCSVLSPLKKSRVVSVNHLVQAGKFAEAKGVAEDMVSDETLAEWARTWYSRGYLCLAAYKEGQRKNDKNLLELYPDQLYVAYGSYSKAASLDKKGKLDKKLAVDYVWLANELVKLGEKQYGSRNYADALKAFEHAILIMQGPVVSSRPDDNLVYNTALSAYESKDWDKAIRYLGHLQEANYSVNVAYLIYNAYLAIGDMAKAEKVLKESIDKYEDREKLVLLLADLQENRNDKESALKTLDKAIAKNPSNHKYHLAKGLINQKAEDYEDAISAYEEAVRLAPDELMIYINIATCYYNIGVGIEENTRSIRNISEVKREKEKSAAAFASAVSWLDRAYEEEPEDKALLEKMYDLYRLLRVTEKVNGLEEKVNGP